MAAVCGKCRSCGKMKSLVGEVCSKCRKAARRPAIKSEVRK